MAMSWPQGVQGISVRILTHERARVGHRSVVEAALAIAHREGLAASVIRAQEGWSARGGARAADQVELSDDLPIIIEIIASAQRIEAALPDLLALASIHGTVTLTDTRLWLQDTPAPQP